MLSRTSKTSGAASPPALPLRALSPRIQRLYPAAGGRLQSQTHADEARSALIQAGSSAFPGHAALGPGSIELSPSPPRFAARFYCIRIVREWEIRLLPQNCAAFPASPACFLAAGKKPRAAESPVSASALRLTLTKTQPDLPVTLQPQQEHPRTQQPPQGMKSLPSLCNGLYGAVACRGVQQRFFQEPNSPCAGSPAFQSPKLPPVCSCRSYYPHFEVSFWGYNPLGLCTAHLGALENRGLGGRRGDSG